jgi:hypothetical protein
MSGLWTAQDAPQVGRMTRFNKLILLAFAAVVLAETPSFAQEREPLAMRIELEWTVAWTVIGALAGAALWLTDPGNPNLSLARQSIEGAAIGAFVGAGFGLYVMQRNIQFPQTAATDVSPSLWGTSVDPITVRDRAAESMASGPPAHPAFTLAAYRMNF